MERLKDRTRDNNVDKTRSTMQRKINSLHKQLTFMMRSASRKNRKLSQYKGFLARAVSTGKVNREELKEFLNKGKIIHL